MNFEFTALKAFVETLDKVFVYSTLENGNEYITLVESLKEINKILISDMST